jgi:hypothetical protein
LISLLDRCSGVDLIKVQLKVAIPENHNNGRLMVLESINQTSHKYCNDLINQSKIKWAGKLTTRSVKPYLGQVISQTYYKCSDFADGRSRAYLGYDRIVKTTQSKYDLGNQ